MDSSDGLLVRQSLQGQTESFAALVDRHRDGAVRAAYHLVGDADAAQDLAQEAFVDAYRGLRNLREPNQFRAWLHGILHHKCSKYLARSARGPLSLDDVDFAPHEPLIDPLAATTLDALNHLPDDCRSLLAARYLQELSYEEIAHAMQTTVNNVRVKCSRAKAQLRALVKQTELASAAVSTGGNVYQEGGLK